MAARRRGYLEAHALTGFVAFMTRTSAEQALEEMDGKVLGRHDLKVNWSKAVPLPAKPIWPPDGDEDESRDDDDRRAGTLARGMSVASGVAPLRRHPPLVPLRLLFTSRRIKGSLHWWIPSQDTSRRMVVCSNGR